MKITLIIQKSYMNGRNAILHGLELLKQVLTNDDQQILP